MAETLEAGGVEWTVLDFGSRLCIWKHRAWSRKNDMELLSLQAGLSRSGYHLLREAFSYHLT